MLIADIMTRKVVTVQMDDTLQAVGEIFHSLKIHHLPVLDGERLAGIISDRDYLRTVSPFVGTPTESSRDLFTINKKAHSVMTRNPHTLMPENKIKSAATLMLQHNISSVPVVKGDRVLVGIVTWRDVLKAWMDPVSRQADQRS